MGVPHLDINGLVWISIGTMSSCLLDELSAMDKNECLGCIAVGCFNSADQLSEDDLLHVNIGIEKGGL